MTEMQAVLNPEIRQKSGLEKFRSSLKSKTTLSGIGLSVLAFGFYVNSGITEYISADIATIPNIIFGTLLVAVGALIPLSLLILLMSFGTERHQSRKRMAAIENLSRRIFEKVRQPNSSSDMERLACILPHKEESLSRTLHEMSEDKILHVLNWVEGDDERGYDVLANEFMPYLYKSSRNDKSPYPELHKTIDICLRYRDITVKEKLSLVIGYNALVSIHEEDLRDGGKRTEHARFLDAKRALENKANEINDEQAALKSDYWKKLETALKD